MYEFYISTRSDLEDQIGKREINRLSTGDIIKLAEENNLNSIIEQFKVNVDKDIQRMKLDMIELKVKPLKYVLKLLFLRQKKSRGSKF
jgi:hypothetical protein